VTSDCELMSRKRTRPTEDRDSLPSITKKRKHSSKVEEWIELQRQPRLTEEAVDDLNEELDMDAQSSCSFTTSDSTGTINAYSSRFEAELRRRGVIFIEDEEERAPTNLDDLKTAIFASRESPEPTEDDVKKFRKRIRKSSNEAAALQSTLSKIIPLDEIWDRDDLLTIPNQQWDKKVSLPSDAPVSTRLATPKPDQTVGLSASTLACDNALAVLRPWAFPVTAAPDLTFPLFTVEGKGDQGNLKVSRLQNLHNAAVMLHNLLQLRKAVGTEQEFFDKAQVCTLGLTTESIELCYYWATQDSDGRISYCGQAINSWNPNSKSSNEYKEARKCARNALGWVLSEGCKWIWSDLKRIEERLKAVPELSLEQNFQITPPQSQADLEEGRKRRRHSSVHDANSASRSASRASLNRLTSDTPAGML